jgi:prolyl oligopeptidase
VYAVACLRGGGEEGEQWHHAGRGAAKKRVFEDFEAAADWLVANGWSAPDRLGILGGSNGGLLVGAALTRHPEKYAAVVCIAPLLDMVRYELSGLGPSWREEYGGVADPEAFENLLSYSPYHNVRVGERYPAVLFVVGDGDTRVDPLHARKMCAALQFASAGPGPILLHAVQGVGHGAGASSTTIALTADSLAFFADRLGLAGADDGAGGRRVNEAVE